MDHGGRGSFPLRHRCRRKTAPMPMLPRLVALCLPSLDPRAPSATLLPVSERLECRPCPTFDAYPWILLTISFPNFCACFSFGALLAAGPFLARRQEGHPWVRALPRSPRLLPLSLYSTCPELDTLNSRKRKKRREREEGKRRKRKDWQQK